MTIKPIFRWFDLWIGVFIDTKNRIVYIFPLPMFGLRITLKPRPVELPPMPTWDEIQKQKKQREIEELYRL